MADKSNSYWDLLYKSIGNAIDLNHDTIIIGEMLTLIFLAVNEQKVECLQSTYGITDNL